MPRLWDTSPEEKEKFGKFEIYLDGDDQWRFRLKASNGRIIAASEGYKEKRSCISGVMSVKKHAPTAWVVTEDNKLI